MLDDSTKIGTVRGVRLPPPFAIPFATLLCTHLALAQDPSPHREMTSESAPNIGYSLRGGLEVGGRWFVYSDPLVIATNLRPYDVTGVPLLTFGGSLRPLIWSHVPILDHTTFSFDYAFAPTLESSTSDEQTVNTNWDHGDVKLHVPIRFDKLPLTPRLGPTLGYGWLGFSFTTSSSLSKEIPTVTYRFVRLGLTGEIAATKRLSILAACDYLSPISGGEVYSRFRDPQVRGIDARAGAAFELAQGTRIFLLVDYTRFFSTFTPIPGDAYVAGGALDQFGRVEIGIEYGR
ncbi:MAG TPA: hypothetical protein PK156_46975 [Polyangium sp.]|nr:hypothetical protein [Polyangium sp.]